MKTLGFLMLFLSFTNIVALEGNFSCIELTDEFTVITKDNILIKIFKDCQFSNTFVGKLFEFDYASGDENKIISRQIVTIKKEDVSGFSLPSMYDYAMNETPFINFSIGETLPTNVSRKILKRSHIRALIRSMADFVDNCEEMKLKVRFIFNDGKIILSGKQTCDFGLLYKSILVYSDGSTDTLNL